MGIRSLLVSAVLIIMSGELLVPHMVQSGAPNRYLGSAACADCHATEYETFTTYAKKAKSDEHVRQMASNLKPFELEGCYGCHTTGYKQPGGFVSFAETPDLGHCGCEVCHGPGQAHVESGGEASLIKASLTFEADCKHCHIDARNQQFDLRPLTKAGAH